ncbi:MAG: transketolase family protein [Lachnospiraceae bacterium]
MSEVKKVATRVSYGNALKELGAEYPDIVVLDADLAGSTQTGIFRKAFPDRHINCGIAEGNMMSIAAGIATTGKIPFASSFAMFATGRAYEQIRNSIAYPHLNVKICATHAGISVGADGASHQCLEDIALMRTLPGMVVMNPADDTEARAAVRAAVEYVGPVYIRFGRAPMPIINDPETFKFEIGKGTVLKEGKDVTIIGSGICTTYALEAEKLLAADGIDAEIINMCTVKPIDADLVAASAKKTGKVVTAEEGFAEGGLGSAVAEVLANRQPAYQLRIGVQDTFGESADAEELLEKYQLDGKGIYKQVKEFLGKLEDQN